MATIDRAILLADEKLYLPAGNVLTDAQMNSINESVIRQVGDDDSKYAEVLCKSLRAIAIANQSKFAVDGRGLKREKVDQVEVERFETLGQDPWQDFINSLKDLCPILGYTGLNTGLGIKINTSEKIVIDRCPGPNKLIF